MLRTRRDGGQCHLNARACVSLVHRNRDTPEGKILSRERGGADHDLGADVNTLNQELLSAPTRWKTHVDAHVRLALQDHASCGRCDGLTRHCASSDDTLDSNIGPHRRPDRPRNPVPPLKKTVITRARIQKKCGYAKQEKHRKNVAQSKAWERGNPVSG